ncbi:MAG: squalene--hopene cyclase [Planctomycetaceae bacterium]|nr:squalene--hopene cyclase [Planctomycetaceae bacterium]
MEFPGIDQDRLHTARDRVTQSLLEQFDRAAGHWFGRLSSSALSTATAVVALQTVLSKSSEQPPTESYDEQRLRDLIEGGLAYLEAEQNVDGGWGDTDKSLSNISTTMLCHAAFYATKQTDRFSECVCAAKTYIDKAGGIPALLKRYGKDKTFSIPILTHCALSGQVEWSEVSSLPFELACLPANFYKTVKLPVVSYALPALIAIGQVKHHQEPTWFLPWRWVRNLARKPSLRVLERIQPESGGFLEATPLTSFVSMSLAGMGLLDHPVLRRGIQFLVDSVRDDGSWPIDTNLATWVTTLSTNALGDSLPEGRAEPIADWLLNQQYQEVHPYTNADPGGWAWTDLSGGVPDADDTPGAILALAELRDRCPEETQSRIDAAMTNGVKWLLDLQNRDGGWPTFCKGWGTLPFDRSSNDITAHALRAIVLWRGSQTDSPLSARAAAAVERGFRYLKFSHRVDGSWLPLWFGNQRAPDDENPTYGTSKVLTAYRDCGRLEEPEVRRGLDWLEANQNADGSWGGGSDTPGSVEESALALETLLSCGRRGSHLELGVNWLISAVESGAVENPQPIGFYFAKLWYYEDLYPLIFTVSALHSASRSDYNKSASTSGPELASSSEGAR